MASLTDILGGIVQRSLGQRNIDAKKMDYKRIGIYGEDYTLPLVPTKHLLADEGSYFRTGSDMTAVAGSQIPGTTVAQQGQIVAFGDTTPLWVIRNSEPTDGSGKAFNLDFLRLLLAGTAPTATLSLELAVVVDTVNRIPAANFTNPALVPMKQGAPIPNVGVYAYTAGAAFTALASSGAKRNVARARIPTGVAIVGDEYVFRFGSVENSQKTGLTAARATDPARITTEAEPVLLMPGDCATIHLWWLTSATNLPTWEWSMGGWAR